MRTLNTLVTKRTEILDLFGNLLREFLDSISEATKCEDFVNTGLNFRCAVTKYDQLPVDQQTCIEKKSQYMNTQTPHIMRG